MCFYMQILTLLIELVGGQLSLPTRKKKAQPDDGR